MLGKTVRIATLEAKIGRITWMRRVVAVVEHMLGKTVRTSLTEARIEQKMMSGRVVVVEQILGKTARITRVEARIGSKTTYVAPADSLRWTSLFFRTFNKLKPKTLAFEMCFDIN